MADDTSDAGTVGSVRELVVGDDDGGATRVAIPTSTIRDWVIAVGGALIVALFVQSFVAQMFYIPSPSMEPTAGVGDRVMVSKMTYRFDDVARGDVVVFDRPAALVADEDIDVLIKRIIALPGDTVESRDGGVFVNGVRLDEPWLTARDTTEGIGLQRVPAGQLYVLGDNRENSGDSRVFGTIRQDSVVGRAVFVAWPLGHVAAL